MEDQITKTSYEVSFIDPEKTIDDMELAAGLSVADFGCGTGYFVFPIAKRIKESGKMYALDVLNDKLEAIESQAKVAGLTNIITKRVNLEKEGGSKLEAESLDWVVIKDMLFQNSNKEVVLLEAKRTLKPGGKILLIEWRKEDGSVGPKNELRISKESMIELVGKIDLTLVKEIFVGDFHYGLIFSK